MALNMRAEPERRYNAAEVARALTAAALSLRGAVAGQCHKRLEQWRRGG